jgi:hypothetical protein
MPSAKELAKALARQDSVTKQPRNRFLGAVADAAGYLSDQADRYVVPERDPLFGGMRGGDLLPLRNVNRLLDDLSYGGRITTGRGQTTTLRPEVVDTVALGAMLTNPLKKGGIAAAMKAAEQVQNKTGFAKFMPDTRMGVVPEGKSFPSQMSEYVPGVKSGDEMLVTHNLTAEKLYGADRLGGMPVPSLGISKLSSPLEGFGDITFVGGREMAVPSKVNPVYKSDAYTKRRPEIQRGMDNKSSANLTNIFGDLPRQLPVRGESELEKLIGNFGDAPNNKLLQAKFLQEKGILPNPEDYADKGQFNEQIYKLRQANQNEYDSWVDTFMQSLPESGVKVKDEIFKGYTPSGNRRYVEANLENIVKDMKGGPNTEGWNYGVGNLRAVATPKFKKFDEITKGRDRLISNDEFANIKQPSDEMYSSISQKLRSLDKNYSPDDAMLEVAETGNINALDRIYKNIPTELKAELSSYIGGLKQMPTNYFEVKPQRSVGIGEFKGALVPSDLPNKARQIIDSAGIKDVYTYANEAERKNLLKKFGKDMFSVMPAIPAGSMLDPQAIAEALRQQDRK